MVLCLDMRLTLSRKWWRRSRGLVFVRKKHKFAAVKVELAGP